MGLIQTHKSIFDQYFASWNCLVTCSKENGEMEN